MQIFVFLEIYVYLEDSRNGKNEKNTSNFYL